MKCHTEIKQVYVGRTPIILTRIITKVNKIKSCIALAFYFLLCSAKSRFNSIMMATLALAVNTYLVKENYSFAATDQDTVDGSTPASA